MFKHFGNGIASLFAMLILMPLSPARAATSILIDDFSDGNDDGWTHYDFSVGDPWGPGTFSASSGAYHLLGGGEVPVGQAGALESFWDSPDDPFYSDGVLKAKVRANNDTMIVLIGMRITSLGAGYAFGGNAVRGNFFLTKFVDGAEVFVDGYTLDDPFQAGEDWMLEASAVGDHLAMKAWKLGEEEPLAPQWTYTDPSALPPGTLGVGAWHWGLEQTRPGIVDAVFDDIYFTRVPEPSGMALMILGAGGVAYMLRRWQRAVMFRHLGHAIAWGSAVLILAYPARCEEIKIVSPNALLNVEAEGGPAGGAPEGRLQQVYPSADFADLPSGTRLLTRFAFRPDGSQSQPVSVTYGDVLIRLSTTRKAVGGLSSVYDENWGANLTTVFAGPLAYSSANSGPVGGPKDFDYFIDLQTEFVYDPEDGNLLVDVAWQDQSSGPQTYDFIVDAEQDVAEFIWSYTQASSSSFRAGGYPTQFTFVPEPSAAPMLMVMGSFLSRYLVRRGELPVV